MNGDILPFRQPPSREEALARVRKIARKTSNIWWTEHVRMQMDDREINTQQALRTIREGEIHGRIVPEDEDEWKMTLRKRDAGQTVHVVVATSGSEDLFVITVF